jgi:hypothetical protein
MNDEPVLNENREPSWLTLKCSTKKATTKRSRSAKEIIKDDKTLLEVPVFELKPQGLWQCRKCGATIVSNPDPPVICYADQGGCDRATNFTPVTKTINPDLWKLPIWRDIPVDDINMLGVYDDMMKLIKDLLVFSEDIEYKVYTLWIISTWKLETWDTVGFPIFIGIPDSGKSRALRIIHQLSYRAPKASGVKQAAIPRLCHYHNITLLIDEAHNKLNPKTETGSGLLEFVKDSYKRGSVYITCDNNSQEKVCTYKNFGFKGFAGEKSFNTGLLSRGLIFWMEKADPEIAKLSYVEDDLNELRTRLLNYRVKCNDPEDLGNDFVLKGRTREIYESIIATGMHIGVDVQDVIEFAKKRDTREIEALKDTVQYDILKIIRDAENRDTLDDAPEKIFTSTILTELNWDDDRSNAQRLGYILRNMGLTITRTSRGRAILLTEKENEKRLMKLYARYGI